MGYIFSNLFIQFWHLKSTPFRWNECQDFYASRCASHCRKLLLVQILISLVTGHNSMINWHWFMSVMRSVFIIIYAGSGHMPYQYYLRHLLDIIYTACSDTNKWRILAHHSLSDISWETKQMVLLTFCFNYLISVSINSWISSNKTRFR